MLQQPWQLALSREAIIHVTHKHHADWRPTLYSLYPVTQTIMQSEANYNHKTAKKVESIEYACMAVLFGLDDKVSKSFVQFFLLLNKRLRMFLEHLVFLGRYK